MAVPPRGLRRSARGCSSRRGLPTEPAMSESFRYSMVIEWSDEDSVFVVSLPEWGDLVHTHGATYEEALQRGKELIEDLIETRQASVSGCHDLASSPSSGRAWGRTRWRPAGGNLSRGTRLVSGRHDRPTPSGERGRPPPRHVPAGHPGTARGCQPGIDARPQSPPLANGGDRRQPIHGYSHPKLPAHSVPGDPHAPSTPVFCTFEPNVAGILSE
jgi:predicted RNase H-like HicB family nuclease